jgi:hypothetical protein
MRLLLLLPLLFSNSGLSAVYTMDFSGASPADPVDGLDGWAQTEPNYADTEVYPRSWVGQMGSSNALSIGGYYDTEPVSDISGTLGVVHSLDLNFEAIDLSFDFSITDSDSFDADRNQFTFGFYDSLGATLWGLHFTPVSQSANPGGGSFDLWNVRTSTNGVLNGSGPFGSVFETAVYSFNFFSLPSETPGDVDWVVSIAGSNTFTSSGIASGLVGVSANSMSLSWGLNGDEVDGLGSNFLTVGGMIAEVAVPEPSAFLLFSLSSLGLLVRRRSF